MFVFYNQFYIQKLAGRLAKSRGTMVTNHSIRHIVLKNFIILGLLSPSFCLWLVCFTVSSTSSFPAAVPPPLQTFVVNCSENLAMFLSDSQCPAAEDRIATCLLPEEHSFFFPKRCVWQNRRQWTVLKIIMMLYVYLTLLSFHFPTGSIIMSRLFSTCDMETLECR
jgi:hypothetical protein